MLLLKVEDKDGNGFRVTEPEAFEFFSIEGARCWHCGASPVVARRVATPKDAAPTVGEVVLCECGERFGAAFPRRTP